MISLNDRYYVTKFRPILLKVVVTLIEKQLLNTIKRLTKKGNRDNISRTKAYEYFFRKYPEIKWALLAGLVSRNAGWNMCDLEGGLLSHLLTKRFRRQLFLTYEEANWRIFQDAYPQFCSTIIQ